MDRLIRFLFLLAIFTTSFLVAVALFNSAAPSPSPETHTSQEIAPQTATPSGGAACEYGGPYQDDPHTLLLLHLDGDYGGVQGETGVASSTSFASGQFGQGVLIDATDTLTYPTACNLNQAAGTIEFWVRPELEGDYGQIHVLFEIDYMDHGIQIVKHGGGDLRFLMRRGEELTDIGAPAGQWRAGEWHHVAATWEGTQMTLYIDGLPQANSNSATPPQILGPVFYLGSSPRGDWQADATIDEFRISDIPRLGGDRSYNRILLPIVATTSSTPTPLPLALPVVR